MNQKKIKTAAAALAILFLLTAGMVGAVSATITYEYNLDTVDKQNDAKLWEKPAGETAYDYWTTVAAGTVTIPIAIVNTESDSYLRAYDFTTTISSLTAETNYRPVAVLLTDGDVTNDGAGNIAAGSGVEGSALAANTRTTFFNVEIDRNELTAGTIYTVSITNNGVVLSPVSSDSGITVGSLSADMGTITALRFKVKENAQITTAKFNTYNAAPMDLSSTHTGEVTVYREHNSGSVTAVLGVNSYFDSNSDTIAWTPSDTSIFNVGAATEDGKQNILTLGGSTSGTTDKKTATLTVLLSNPGYTDSANVITVNVDNWWQGTTTNYNAGGSASTGGTNWNFDNALTYSVDLGGRTVDLTGGDWDTGVTLSNVNTGITRTALTNYIAEKIVGTTGADASWSIPAGYKLSNNSGALSVNSNPTTAADKITISYAGYKLGDANTDDNINIVDSAVVGIHILKGGVFLNDEQKIYADCGSLVGSGTIDVNDILAINKKLVGLDPWSA